MVPFRCGYERWYRVAACNFRLNVCSLTATEACVVGLERRREMRRGGATAKADERRNEAELGV